MDLVSVCLTSLRCILFSFVVFPRCIQKLLVNPPALPLISPVQQRDLIPRGHLFKVILFICGRLLFNLLVDLPHDLIIIYRYQLLMSIDWGHFFFRVYQFALPILGIMSYHQLIKIILGSNLEVFRRWDDRNGGWFIDLIRK